MSPPDEHQARAQDPDSGASALDHGAAAGPAPVPVSVLPALGEPAGVTLARLAVLLAVAIGVVRGLDLGRTPAWGVLAAVTAGALLLCPEARTALAGAGVAWLLGTGFVAHRLGDLSFDAADREHLLVLLLAAGVALAAGRRVAAAGPVHASLRVSRSEGDRRG